jgi:hypothetical protein
MKDKAVLLFSLETEEFCACLVSDWRVVESKTTVNGGVWNPPNNPPEKSYAIGTSRPVSDLLRIRSERASSPIRYPSWIPLGVYERPFIRDMDKIVKATAKFARALL